MFKFFTSYLFIACTIITYLSSPLQAISVTTRAAGPQHYVLTISFALKPNDHLYSDSLNYSIDCPHATISNPIFSTSPIDYYDTESNEQKKIIRKSFTITLDVLLTKQSTESIACNLLLTYYLHSAKKEKQESFPLSFQIFNQLNPVNINQSVEKQPQKLSQKNSKSSYLYSVISNRINHTNSLWLQLLFALLLGLLVSFTPCIYPMIPITIGILQSQSSKSVYRNFLLALAYSIGLATTFALLGLMAAFTGQLFGSLLTNKWFVLTIVAIMVYVACSMIGFYDLYLPTFIQPGSLPIKGGSYISAFIFGAVSGTVASPCLSPGLLLLLTLVTTIGNKVIGFALLFSFGIGLSIPLLLIGTFSSSLSAFPQAGQWMVDIKQLSGFLMLGVCFYFLTPLMPSTIILAGLGIYLLGLGIWYITTAYSVRGPLHIVKIVLGIMLIAAALLVGAQYIQKLIIPVASESNWWQNNYTKGLAAAREMKKPILLEITGDFCSICSAIDKKIFCNSQVQTQVLATCIPIKIKNLDSTDETHAYLAKKFNIVGVPACLVINPDEESCYKQWGPELYDLSPEQFLEELTQHCNQRS